MKKCKFCGKKLVRKRVKDGSSKKGWRWETPANFKKRMSCRAECKFENLHKNNERVKTKCAWCGKVLKKRKCRDKRFKRGWKWECPYRFKVRKFCCQSHGAKFIHKQLGHTSWTEDLIKKEFDKIKTEKKYRVEWLKENYGPLAGGIQTIYGKNSWNKFLTDIGEEHRLGIDWVRRGRVPLARKMLTYFTQELDVSIGDTFEYSYNDGIPIANIAGSDYCYYAMKILKERKAVKLLKMGRAIGLGDWRYAYPSTYKLLKNRI